MAIRLIGTNLIHKFSFILMNHCEVKRKVCNVAVVCLRRSTAILNGDKMAKFLFAKLVIKR